MRLTPHLTFAGNCEEAFQFYQRALDGTDLRLFKDGPKVVHASLNVGGTGLAGADVEAYQPPRGFYVLHHVASADEAARLFSTLSEGGVVAMALGKTFWSPAFGVVVDRFGTPWEVTC